MKILFVTYNLPYPLNSGGKVRAYNLIKELSREHEITLFSYYRDNSQLEYVGELRKYCVNVHLFMRTKVFSTMHFVNTILHPGLTAHISHYYHKDLKLELVRELKYGNYDVLHLESFYTSHLLGDYGVWQVLGTENIEWKIYKGHSEIKPLVTKIPLLLETYRTKLFERSTWKKADAILAVSDSDSLWIRENTAKPVYVVPNGVDLEYFRYEKRVIDKDALKFLYVGDYAYIQNKDSIYWLQKDIYPAIRAVYLNSTLTIVGKNIPDNFQKSDGVTIRRNAEDIRDVYSKADILLAPLRVSSGTQFKLLEAMATGVIVLTTPLGLEGLNAKSGEELIVFNGQSDVVSVINDLIKSASGSDDISTNARSLVESEYSWNIIGNKLRGVYAKLAK